MVELPVCLERLEDSPVKWLEILSGVRCKAHKDDVILKSKLNDSQTLNMRRMPVYDQQHLTVNSMQSEKLQPLQEKFVVDISSVRHTCTYH